MRYDGIYRIEKCWQAIGTQKVEMCRYLFVRCDNEPAPWTSDGTRPRPRPRCPRVLLTRPALRERRHSSPAARG